MITVSVAKNFTRFPSGRYKDKGSTSGQAFRERFLESPIAEGQVVEVDFDGTVGYGSSFLEEAFGGLVRALRRPAGQLLPLLRLKSSDPTIPEEVKQYIQAASDNLANV